VHQPRILLMLLPHRTDVVVTNARGQRESVSFPSGLPSDADVWVKAIDTLVGPIGRIVVRLGLQGARTTVIYRSPFQASDVSVFPVTSAAEACEGARLALLESLPGASLATITDTLIVGSDRLNGTVRQHVAAVGDREDVIDALHALVTAAGLRFESAVPLDAAMSIHVTSQALAGPPRTNCLIHIGESSSFIAARIGDAVVLTRRIGLGTAALAAALTRPIIRSGQEDECALSPQRAEEILHTFGVPDRDQIIDESLQLRGRDVVPLLQPVLQRLLVEIRQSIRFGVPPEHHEDLTVELVGPGAALPGLSRVVQEECALPVHVTEQRSEGGVPPSDIDMLLQNRNARTGLSLRPVDMQQQQRTSAFRRRIWLGAAAALSLVIYDGLRRHTLVQTLERQHEAQIAFSADAQRQQIERTAVVNALAALRDTESKIHATHGAMPNLRAGMQEVSLLLPDSIRLTSLAFRTMQDRMVGDLSGIARVTNADGSQQLMDFVQSLEESPLFEHVVLGHVTSAHFGTTEGIRFNVSFVAVDLPARHHLIAVAGEHHARAE